jgi:hypothetical protein
MSKLYGQKGNSPRLLMMDLWEQKLFDVPEGGVELLKKHGSAVNGFKTAEDFFHALTFALTLPLAYRAKFVTVIQATGKFKTDPAFTKAFVDVTLGDTPNWST